MVLQFWIALWKPKSNLEAIKQSYYYTVNQKFVRNSRALHISPQKGYSTPSVPTKQVRTRCNSTCDNKTIFQNNWLLASFYRKPNSAQKTPCFRKIRAERVFLGSRKAELNWNFDVQLCTRQKLIWKQQKMKGYSWIAENTSLSKNALLNNYIKRLF